jgi:hypothetical protein
MTTTTYLLDDMVVYLEGYSPPFGFTDENLMEGWLPDQPDAVVALFEYNGLVPIYTMGPQTLPQIGQPHLQVVVRDVTYTGARDTCEGVTRALEGITNEVVNTTFYQRVSRLQDPFFMHRDAVKNRVYFACNFEVMRTPS